VRRIGRPDVARDVLEALMLERGLRRSFPRAVEGEATDVAQEPPDGDPPRQDFTGLATFTIDPATARDYDDAISARREGGLIRVWVHIADVSAYVRPGSALERET
jgi:ribonuclease R